MEKEEDIDADNRSPLKLKTEEIQAAIKKFKNGKAQGSDDITSRVS